MEVVSKTKSDIKSGLKHPVALFFFGMLFAAFLFPMVATWLGKLKAGGGTVSKLIPTSFTKAAS
jgi:hypothetical protein